MQLAINNFGKLLNLWKLFGKNEIALAEKNDPTNDNKIAKDFTELWNHCESYWS